jgi:hypothetical protein
VLVVLVADTASASHQSFQDFVAFLLRVTVLNEEDKVTLLAATDITDKIGNHLFDGHFLLDFIHCA